MCWWQTVMQTQAWISIMKVIFCDYLKLQHLLICLTTINVLYSLWCLLIFRRLVLVISLAAAFCTDCNRWNGLWVMPYYNSVEVVQVSWIMPAVTSAQHQLPMTIVQVESLEFTIRRTTDWRGVTKHCTGSKHRSFCDLFLQMSNILQQQAGMAIGNAKMY